MSTYMTMQGDMWDSISYKVFGDVAYTDKIMNLNHRYRNIYIFPAGITLTLPEPEDKAVSTLPPWKQVGSV